jgi:hypothetical protein
MVRVLVGKYEENRQFRRCWSRDKNSVTCRNNIFKNRLKGFGVE